MDLRGSINVYDATDFMCSLKTFTSIAHSVNIMFIFT